MGWTIRQSAGSLRARLRQRGGWTWREALAKICPGWVTAGCSAGARPAVGQRPVVVAGRGNHHRAVVVVSVDCVDPQLITHRASKSGRGHVSAGWGGVALQQRRAVRRSVLGGAVAMISRQPKATPFPRETMPETFNHRRTRPHRRGLRCSWAAQLLRNVYAAPTLPSLTGFACLRSRGAMPAYPPGVTSPVS